MKMFFSYHDIASSEFLVSSTSTVEVASAEHEVEKQKSSPVPEGHCPFLFSFFLGECDLSLDEGSEHQ